MDVQALVLDPGSTMMKAGFAGDDAPRAVFPSIVGHPRYPACMTGIGPKTNYVGDEAQSRRGTLTLRCPIKRGCVDDWDEMEMVVHHTFYNELSVAPEEHPVLVIDSVCKSKANREKMCQIMFESFNVPAMAMELQEVAAMYSVGNLHGLSVNLGGGNTSIVPLYEGYAITSAIETMNLCGSDITEYLAKLLAYGGNHFSTSAEMEIVRDIKEKLCYVASDFTSEFYSSRDRLSAFLCGSLSRTGAHSHASDVAFNVRQLITEMVLKEEKESTCNTVSQRYELPDGASIEVAAERFCAPEIYFLPALIGLEDFSLPQLCFNSILKSDTDIRKDLFARICIFGGSSMFPGISERLQTEILACTLSSHKNARIKILALPERKYSAWVGGSIIASINPATWLEKEEYDEKGPGAIHSKFL